MVLHDGYFLRWTSYSIASSRNAKQMDCEKSAAFHFKIGSSAPQLQRTGPSSTVWGSSRQFAAPFAIICLGGGWGGGGGRPAKSVTLQTRTSIREFQSIVMHVGWGGSRLYLANRSLSWLRVKKNERPFRAPLTAMWAHRMRVVCAGLARKTACPSGPGEAKPWCPYHPILPKFFRESKLVAPNDRCARSYHAANYREVASWVPPS